MKEVSAAPGSNVAGDTIICPLTGEEISPCCCPLNKRKSLLKKMLAALGFAVMIGIGVYAAGFSGDGRATVAAPVTSAAAETIICPLTGEEISPCCCPLNESKVAGPVAVASVTSAPADTIICPLTGERISPCCCPLNDDQDGK